MKSWIIAKVDNNKWFLNLDFVSERIFNRQEAETMLLEAKVKDPENVFYLFEAVAEARNEGVFHYEADRRIET
jgi:hypothetical protein